MTSDKYLFLFHLIQQAISFVWNVHLYLLGHVGEGLSFISRFIHKKLRKVIRYLAVIDRFGDRIYIGRPCNLLFLK